MSGPSLTAGTIVASRYRLEQELGRGGMGVVWAATHTVTERAVALKFLKGPAHQESQLRQRFLREARAASAVRHPNVVEVLDVFELEDGTPVMVLERLIGETLGQRLARLKEQTRDAARLSLEATATLLVPAISALGTAHAHGIVHRDLKPDNLFIEAPANAPQRVKVLDFGIAKLLERSAGTTETGAVLGTPCYMAPEQALAEKHIDQRADIWAFGVILYECLSGQRPVEGDSLGQVVLRIVNDGIRPLADVVEGLPTEVTALVDRMLERERERRPADLRQVLGVLERYTPARAPPFGAASPPRASEPPAVDAHAKTEQVTSLGAVARPVTPKSAAARGVALVFLLGALGVAIVMLARRPAPSRDAREGPAASTPSAARRAHALRARRLTASPADNPIWDFDIAPGGNEYVYLDNTGVWLASVQGGPPRRLKHAVLDRLEALRDVVFMPDGRTLVVFRENPPGRVPASLEIALLPIAGGEARVLPLDDTGGVRALEFISGPLPSPDGRQLALGAKGALLALDVASGRARIVTTVGGQSHVASVSWSPDASRLAYISGSYGLSTPAELVVVRADGQAAQRLLVDARLQSNHCGASVFWLDDRRLAFTRQNPVDEAPGSALWELELTDQNTGRGEPRLMHRWDRQFAVSTISRASRRILAQVCSIQGDVYVGELEEGGRKLVHLTRLTLDEADDWPTAWHPDGRVLFMSDRYGTWDVLAQAPGSREAEVLAGSRAWETWPKMVGRSVGFWKIDPGPAPAGRRAELMLLDGSKRAKRVLERAMENDLHREARAPPFILGFGCVRPEDPVCVLSEDRGDKYALRRFDPVTGRVDKPLYERPGREGMWDIAPDGRTLALVGADWAGLILVSLKTGQAREIKLEGTWVTVHWLPDASALILTGASGDGVTSVIARIDLRGKMEVLQRSQTGWFWRALPSPDGKRLAYGLETNRRNLELLEGW